jgi:hypothetical protein
MTDSPQTATWRASLPMVAVRPSAVFVTVVGGWGGIAAPGICAKDEGEFRRVSKRRASIVADSLMRAGRTVVVDITVGLRLNGFLTPPFEISCWLSETADPSATLRSVEKHVYERSAELQIPRLRSG